jgi:hypothetical protein
LKRSIFVKELGLRPQRAAKRLPPSFGRCAPCQPGPCEGASPLAPPFSPKGRGRAGTAAELGVKRRSPEAGMCRWLDGISDRSLNRAYHYKWRNEPESARLRRVVTIASVEICSFDGSAIEFRPRSAGQFWPTSGPSTYGAPVPPAVSAVGRAARPPPAAERGDTGLKPMPRRRQVEAVSGETGWA